MTNLKENFKYLDRSYFFKIQRLFLRFVGFWPGDDKSSILGILRAILHASFLYIVVGFEINFAFVFSDKLALVLDCLTPTCTKFVTATKVLVVIWRRKQIKILLNVLRDLMSENSDSAMKINNRACKYSYIFALFIGIFSNFTSTFFTLIPLIKEFYLYLNGFEFQPVLPFKAVFPFDVTKSPKYEIIYFLLSYSAYVTSSSFTALDGLFVGLCIHLAGQFDILKDKIDNLNNDVKHEELEKISEEENVEIYRKISEIVERHNYTMDLSVEMSKLLTPNILLHYISAAFVICICSLSIMLASGADKLIFINYIMAATSQVLAYSVGGSLLSNSSHRIKFAAYNFPWYKCNLKIRKALLMIIQRADRETGVDVPFFHANIETFGSIMSAALSYITLLKTFL